LLNTILVPVFKVNLWSVASFNASGYVMVFTRESVHIVMHQGTPNEFIIYVRHPYHRTIKGIERVPQYAYMAQSIPINKSLPYRNAMIRATAPKKKILLELLHRRLGHAAVKTLLAADQSNLYDDVKIEFEPTGPCLDCQIATIRSANRGKKSVGESTIPGQVNFLDIIQNPSRTGLTSSTHYPYYLNVVDSYSRYQVFIGMRNITASACIEALEQLGSLYRPSRTFVIDDISELHVDSGSQLISAQLQQWARDRNRPITIIAAAPAHQEMNGKAEANWKVTRQIAYKMLTHARLNLALFDMALRYAWQVKAVLPLPSLIVDSPTTTRPGTPFECFFGKRPSIGRYKVFGCPCVVKVYTRASIDSNANARTLDNKNLVQRGVRGIFVGFPINQAGYLTWIPTSGHLLASVDVQFDEDFTSPLAYPDRIFHDAQPTRNPLHQPPSIDVPTAHTGPPTVQPDDADPTLSWIPSQSYHLTMQMTTSTSTTSTLMHCLSKSSHHLKRSNTILKRRQRQNPTRMTSTLIHRLFCLSFHPTQYILSNHRSFPSHPDLSTISRQHH
jgi:transposase InsO family protein